MKAIKPYVLAGIALIVLGYATSVASGYISFMGLKAETKNTGIAILGYVFAAASVTLAWVAPKVAIERGMTHAVTYLFLLGWIGSMFADGSTSFLGIYSEAKQEAKRIVAHNSEYDLAKLKIDTALEDKSEAVSHQKAMEEALKHGVPRQDVPEVRIAQNILRLNTRTYTETVDGDLGKNTQNAINEYKNKVLDDIEAADEIINNPAPILAEGRLEQGALLDRSKAIFGAAALSLLGLLFGVLGSACLGFDKMDRTIEAYHKMDAQAADTLITMANVVQQNTSALTTQDALLQSLMEEYSIEETN